MKIVQSFWSKPLFSSSYLSNTLQLYNGWPHRVLNYYSWALSCSELNTYYGNVELVTDDLGKELLIDRLKLPYTSVNTALNDLAGFNRKLMFLGKLYACGLQTAPFLHIDGDIFISQKLDESTVNAPLVAQNYEIANARVFLGLFERLGEIPDYYKTMYENPIAKSANSGIIGGSDISFFRDFVKEGFAFLERNMDRVEDAMALDYIGFNLCYEQLLFSQFAAYRDRSISFFLPEIEDYYHPETGVGYFHAAEENKGFIHCLAGYKRFAVTHANVEHRLKTKYPEQYHRINDLLNLCEI